jgi:hypothetical protein
MDIDDISSQYDLFPSLNPKNLPHMMPPMVRFTKDKHASIELGITSF